MNNTIDTNNPAKAQAAKVRELFSSLREEIQKVFVGQTELIDFVLYSVLADGHVLIEGVPGLGKTLLVRTLASSLNLISSRIQFTPDLMPSDITGTNVLVETADGGHELRFQAGSLMAGIVLADEINRATPKTQSALLEAMQERQITIGTRTMPLPEPFMVLATQNPIEQEGTYPLPEAQLDRFLVKLIIDYPKEEEYHQILERTTTSAHPHAEVKFHAADILAAREIVREVGVSTQVRTYAIRVTMATQPNSPYAPDSLKKHVAFGAGPRAAQALLLLAKVRAMVDGRFAVSCQDIRDVAIPVLRHRLVLNFSGLSSRIKPDDLAVQAIANVKELTE